MFKVKKLFRIFLRWFYSVLPGYSTFVVEEELPKKLKKRALYVVQEDGYVEFAAMLCPCGCGKILYMNLLTDERPCWRVKIHKNNTASLHPSVNRQKGCCSHFWFKKGRVVWCDDAE